MHKLSIFGPPLLLLVIGAAVYIMMVKLTTPQPVVIRSTPQATVAAQASSSAVSQDQITTQVTVASQEQLTQWQKAADTGAEVWRLDPLSAAKQQSLSYGFKAEDAFSLVQANGQSATVVIAQHDNQRYDITMYQPGLKGSQAVWSIQSIALWQE
jgi:uncharacterized protein (DUF342 family)